MREETKQRHRPVQGSFWVLLGFILWFGFFLGALIMHAVTK